MIAASPINPGRMDRRITLRYPLKTQSATGTPLKEWVDVATVWASWLPQGGREVMTAKARHALSSGVFRIRFIDGLSTEWQVVNGDNLFDLTAAEEIGRAEYLDLIVTATNAKPGSALSFCTLHDGSYELLHDGSYCQLHPAASQAA